MSVHDSEKLQEPGDTIVKEVDPEQGYSKDHTYIIRATADPNYKFDVTDIDHVQRRLKQRHVQM